MKTWIIRIVFAAIALVLITVLGVSAWMVERFHASKPRQSGEVTLSVLDSPAHVVRDANGIAHIFWRQRRRCDGGVGLCARQ